MYHPYVERSGPVARDGAMWFPPLKVLRFRVLCLGGIWRDNDGLHMALIRPAKSWGGKVAACTIAELPSRVGTDFLAEKAEVAMINGDPSKRSSENGYINVHLFGLVNILQQTVIGSKNGILQQFAKVQLRSLFANLPFGFVVELRHDSHESSHHIRPGWFRSTIGAGLCMWRVWGT